MSGIFGINLLEERSIFFDFGPLFDKSVFAVDLFNLFRLQIILGLEFCDFCKFFVDVADLLLESSQERFILLVYSLNFDFGVFSFLWLWFF